MPAEQQSRWPLVRDILVFIIGAIIVLTELVAWLVSGRAPDPSLLVLATAALGLPIFLRKDEK